MELELELEEVVVGRVSPAAGPAQAFTTQKTKNKKQRRTVFFAESGLQFLGTQ